MDQAMLEHLSQLFSSNPQAFGLLMQGGAENPEGFATMADSLGLPLPGSEEFNSIMNPMSGLGAELSGGPPPVTPAMPMGAGAQIDPSAVFGSPDMSMDVMGGQQPQLAGGPMGTSRGPGGTVPAIQQQQRPLGRIPVASGSKNDLSGGVAGSQKVPDTTAIKGPSPILAVLQQILAGKGGAQQRQQLPGLGAMLGGQG